MRWLRAELAKLVGLPGVWVATGIAVVAPMAFTLLAIQQIRQAAARGAGSAFSTTVDLAFGEFQFTMIAAVVLGVVAAGSEYTPSNGSPGAGRQISTSLLVCPGRGRLLLAKTAALMLVAVATSAVSIGLAMAVARGSEPEWGDPAGRFLGAVGYWCAVALLSYSIGLWSRNTAVPIAVLGLNLSVISISFLLLQITPLARYLPDLAGAGLLLRDLAFEPLRASTGAGVMAAWVVVLLALGGTVFVRRDA